MPPKKPRHSRLDPSNEINAFIERMGADELPATAAQMRKFRTKVSQLTSYQPKVGVFGKTGAGKSSLCNALFGQRIAKVSNVKACTRSPQEVLVTLTPEGNGLTLVDVPGVGESEKRDIEYQELYESLLPELDVVLWVIKGDDRAFSIDERFYKDIVFPIISEYDIPIVFVVNQVDKITPFREWDQELHKPGKKQAVNIKAKLADVRRIFKTGRKLPTVVGVSADENYGLVELVNMIVESLPDEKKYGFAREVREEHISKKAEANVKRGFWNAVKETAHKVFIAIAPKLIENGIKWLFKAIIPG